MNAVAPNGQEKMLWLYGNAIILSMFSQESQHRETLDISDRKSELAPMVLGQDVIEAKDDVAPILPNIMTPDPQDELRMLQIALHNLIRLAYAAAEVVQPPTDFDDDLARLDEYYEGNSDIPVGLSSAAAFETAVFMMDNLKTYYLSKFFPRAMYGEVYEEDRRVSRIEFHNDPGMGFTSCPQVVLRLFLAFFIKYCVDDISREKLTYSYKEKRNGDTNGSLHGENLQEEASSIQETSNMASVCAMMTSIFFGTEESRIFIREFLKQIFVLKPVGEHVDMIRAALYLYGAMLTGPVRYIIFTLLGRK